MTINAKKIFTVLSVCAMAIVMSTHTSAFNADLYAPNSRLKSGKWVKVKVSDSGLYSISNNDARRWGFSGNKNLRIFGYGGAQLPEYLADDFIDDLPQVPVIRDADKVYFYAQGPVTWTLSGGQWVHAQNYYATAGYYLITEDADIDDLTPEIKQQEVNSNAAVVTTFTEHIFHEHELASAGSTGRRILGEDFRFNTNQTFKFAIPGNTGRVNVTTCFTALSSDAQTSLRFTANGSTAPSTARDMIASTASADILFRETSTTKTFDLAGATNLDFTVTAGFNGPVSLARLDYIIVNYERTLALSNGYLNFRGSNMAPSSETLEISGSAETRVFDVTNHRKPIEIATTPVASSAVRFTSIAAGNREYVAFTHGASAPTPEFVGNVANQDLHGEATPDMIIITHKDLVNQANRLAKIHENVDGMRVLVVDQNKVFNEFSSGTPDVMAYRKMCKMFYDRGTDESGHHLGHLLIIGSSIYDNRLIIPSNRSYDFPWVLCWESTESASKGNSYCSDDVLGALDDNATTSTGKLNLNIAIGRIPVTESAQLRNVVDKINDYLTKPLYGTWKTSMINLADDENDGIHMQQADAVVKNFQENGGKDYIYNKIYIDAYDAVFMGIGRQYPVARQKFHQLINEGAVWLNYTGHANEESWTGENILNHQDINSMYNKRWPFIYAATCDFARYDKIETPGAARMLTTSQGGVIGIFTANREVYIPNNGQLNNRISTYALRRDADGKTMPVGEAIRLGKNDLKNDENKLRYLLVGDPALRLHCPSYEARLESINGYRIGDEKMPTFEARQTLTFEGNIYTPDGAKAQDFNGTITSTLFDVEQSIESYGYVDSTPYVFLDRSNRLAIQCDTVVGGHFSVKVTVPSETLAPDAFDNYTPARITFYANDSRTQKEAMGSDDSFYIYGFDNTIAIDNEGPAIEYMVLNSTSFRDGDPTNESPLLMARVCDPSGINFSTSGIGHNITLSLDGKENFSDVAAYYTPEYDAGGANCGVINYPLQNLKPGEHTLRLKVWDVFNNATTHTISFVVVPGLKPEIYELYSTTNPAKTEAVFYLKHNFPESLLTVNLDVFDLMGRQVWTTKETGRSNMFKSFPITWDLTDFTGRRVPRGIYVYRAIVSTDGETTTTKAKKLAVAAE